MKTNSGATRISLSNERTIPMATNTPLKPTIGLKDWIENVRKLAPEARIPYIVQIWWQSGGEFANCSFANKAKRFKLLPIAGLAQW
jgi:hypothetical protein